MGGGRRNVREDRPACRGQNTPQPFGFAREGGGVVGESRYVEGAGRGEVDEGEPPDGSVVCLRRPGKDEILLFLPEQFEGRDQ